MDQKMLDKFSEIANNEAAYTEAQSIKTPEEMQTFLADNGLEMTIEDIKAIASAYAGQYSSKNEELSEEQLETVSGGGRFFKVFLGTAGCVLAISIGSPVAAALLGFGAIGAALGY